MAAWRATITCAVSTLGKISCSNECRLLGLTSYCRFFYKHELLQKYTWYWRLEPEIKYFCDIT